MYAQSQRTTGPKQRNEWDQDRSPIIGNNHSKSIEEAGMSQSRRYTWRPQPSICSSSRLTASALFGVKLQFVKVPLLPLLVMKTAPPCKQVDRTTQPHTHTQTHTKTTVSPCIHSIIHSIHHIHSITLSQERTKHHRCHSSHSTIIHPSTMHCMDDSVWHS